jgi:transcription elongation factor GreA
MDNEETTWLTPTTFERLKAEYAGLTGPGRVEIEARIAEARSHGDLRENADYDAAKNAQGMMEARIRQLRHILENAVVREAMDSGKVEVGSIVVAVDSDGDELEYFVATPENKVRGYVLASPSSPMGLALLGATVGQEVTYQAPGGTFTLKVLDIKPYQG